MRISSGLSGALQENMYDGITVLGTISEGRMFRIHKARRGTKYIILKSAVRNDAMTTEFLRREYELGSTLSHSCIVTTLGFEEDTPAGPALILEYVEGQSLDEFLSCGPSDSAKDCIIDDILDGVDYLHHRGVLHNDIKPSNIVVNPHGAARIIDFGLSISDDSVYKGCMGGSPGYSAPEICSFPQFPPCGPAPCLRRDLRRAVRCVGFHSTLPAGSTGTLVREIFYDLLLNLFLTSPRCIFDRLLEGNSVFA